MKRIVIVDDRPWKMQNSILELQKENIVFYRTVYCPNNELDKERRADI